MAKPTPRQMKIVEAMRGGARLRLWHGFNPYAMLEPTCGVRVMVNDPFNMKRKGIIQIVDSSERITHYELTEEWK